MNECKKRKKAGAKQQCSSVLLSISICLFCVHAAVVAAGQSVPASEPMNGLVTCREFVRRPPGRDRKDECLSASSLPSDWYSSVILG